MPIKRRTKSRLILVISLVVALILSGIAFVSYFMHAVYEKEELLEPDEVPMPVRVTFNKQFPDATEVEWKFGDGFYEAMFQLEDQEEVEAYFTPEGAWSRTECVISFDELPEKAQTYLKSQRFKVVDVERVESKDTSVAYETQIGEGLLEWDCTFDADGNLISKIREGSLEEQDEEEDN